MDLKEIKNYFFIPNIKMSIKIGQNVTHKNLSRFVVSSLSSTSDIKASMLIPVSTPMAK
jgi:hypothetical protein